MSLNPIQKWHEFAQSFGDASILDEIIADDACFESPVVYAPQLGKELTIKYLYAAASVFKDNNFHYLNEWIGDNSAVLEFEATIDGIIINGIDMIFWDENGKINRFKVMVRPYKAINLLMQMMAERLMK